MIENMLRILSSQQVESLHEKTLQVFEDVGLEVMDEQARAKWMEWGAKQDPRSHRIFIPPDLTKKGIESISKTISCGARDDSRSFMLGDGTVKGRNGGGPGQLTDHITGKMKDASLEDCANFARIADALENIDIVAPLYEQESDPGTRDVNTLLRMFKNSSKHINIRLLNPESLPFFMEIAEVVAGGKAELKESPVITMLESPIAPLKHPKVLTDTILCCGDYGIPLEICSMPIAGATGPVTLAGSLLMSNVEMLGAVIFGQLAYPGTPMIFTPRIMVMDMASGYALTGSVENALLVTAGAQMAKELYQIPVNMHGPYTDSPIPDCQAGIENAYFSLLPAFAGADILTGAGHLQGGLIVNFNQLVIDNDILGMVNRALEGLKVDDEMIGFEAVRDSVIDDNLLMHPHTLRHMREKRNRPKLVSRESRTNWMDKGSRSMEDRARDWVRDILDKHEPMPLDANVEKELDKIASVAERTLSGGISHA